MPFGGIGSFTCHANNPEFGNTRKLLGGDLEWRVVAASMIFYIPFYRDISLGGGVVDASRYTARYVLEDMGLNCVLCPGGATEALHAANDRNVAYIKTRAGFVK